MKTRTLLGTRKRAIVNRFENYVVVIEPISSATVTKMENQQLTNGSATYEAIFDVHIPSYDVLLYGNINFRNKKDIKLLKRFEGRLWDIMDVSHFIYTNINFDMGYISKENNDDKYKGYTCTNIVDWIKYNYMLIGNPKYVCIYRYPIGKFVINCPAFFKQ